MKKLILVAILLSLTSCAYIQKWTDAQAWCAANTECLADTKKYSEIGKQVAGMAYPVAGPIAGGVLTYLLLGIIGMKKKPKDSK